MARLIRSEVIDPNEVTIVHVLNRTVRRCFLFGDDPLTGKNFDHRKAWIEGFLKQFAAQFGIDLLCYSILSNHYHLVLRTRPDVVASWSDTEVARRWLMLCPLRKNGSQPAEPNEAELNGIRNCPVRLAEIRSRLSNISWWMRLLNQRIAQRANREEEENGRFFQDRFRATRIIDEASLLACCAYVELNPIRAAMAETIEKSDHTSVQRRIEAELQDAQEEASPVPAAARRDAFLAQLTNNEKDDPIGPVAGKTGLRCSDKGFLAMELQEYLQLLDWTARQIAPGKRGSTPDYLPPVLKRLGLAADSWNELVCKFGKTFVHVAGRSDAVDRLRSHITRRRFRLRPAARKLLPSLN